MAYTTLEKMRLEEYKRNKELQKSGGTSINMPASTINSNITLPTAQSSTWFKKGQGNILQNTLGTTGDSLLNLGKGINSIGEGIKNTIGTTFINAASPLTRSEKLLTGTDHLEDWRNKATQDVLNFNPVSDILDKATTKVDKYSVLGDKSDSIAQGIGYYGGMVALETLGIPWQATSASTGFGNSYEEAINEGSSRESAVVYSLGSAAAEVASEYLFSGLKLPGTGKTADKLIEAATDKIRNKVANQLVKFGVNTVGEGVEELVSGTASEVMKRLTYMKDEDKNMFQNIGAGIKDYYKNQALDEFVSGVLVSAITGASTNLINKTQSASKNINLQLTDNPTKNSLSENITTNNNLTNENLYQYTETNNEKINNLRKSAVEVGKFVNNEKTTGVMSVAEKIISDKNYNIVFDNTLTNDKGNMVNAQITTLENGETEIRLNPNSERAAEFLLIHEVSHGIKTQEMIDLVNDYASKNAEFNKAVKSLEQLYGKDLTSEEVFADVCGELFGNQEFINNLSVRKPNIFRQIYNKIVELANKITGNSNEALFIRDLKNKWENAYRTQNNNLDGTQYSTIGPRGAKNLSKNSNDSRYNQLYAYLKTAKDIADQNKGKSLETRNIETKKQTQWYQTEYDDWGTIISDKDAEIIKQLEPNKTYKLGEVLKHDLLYQAYPGLKNLPVKTMDDIPSTAAYRSIKWLPTNTLTNDIVLKNSDINKKDFRKSLLHEINHFIEGYEKYNKNSRGADRTKMTIEEYRNNLGEIISNETKILADLTQEKLDNIILFEQGKSNPQDKNIRKALDLSNKLDRLNNRGVNNAIRNNGQIDKNQAKNQNQVDKKTTKFNSRRNSLDIDEVYNEIGESNEKTNINNKKTNIKSNLVPKERQSINDRIGRKREIKYEISDSMDSNNLETTEGDTYNRSLRSESRGREGLDNSSFSLKQKQLDIILKNNPVYDDYHTWIRSIDDIKTLEETLNDGDWADYDEFNPDLTKQDIEDAINTGKITVYSSYPIEQGIFVSPSRMEAESYSANGKIYSKKVEINDVAWIDPTQGQYAKVNNNLYSQQANKWQEHLEKNYKATGTRTKFSEMKSNTTKQNDNNSKTKNQTKKIMNPLEISKITKEDANTTPILKKINVSTGDGESKFASNIRNKTDMLSESSKDSILSSDDVRFYEKVTNQESLKKAFEKLNKNGKSEVFRWLNNKENITSVDVAEGWILLKQYQDKITKMDNLIEKDNATKEMVQVAKKLRESGTIAGQAVQAFNILNRLTPEGMVYYAQSELDEAYEKMSKNKTKEWIDSNRDRFELTPEETQFIMDTMQEVQHMEDGYDKRVKLAEIQKVMTDKLPPERGAGIKSWMRISMLFNPKTQVRNVMGNAVIAPVNSFSDLFANMVDKQIAKKTGIRTTGKTNLKNYTKGFKTGLYQSYNDFKKGINTRNIEGNRFEIKEGKSFDDNSLIGKNLNRVDSLLSFMLDAGDRGFYEASFTNSINNQMILNNTTEVTQEMIDIATSEALSRTWQDNNNYTKGVLWVRNWFNNVNIKGYGLGDILIPFAKTPANLTKAIVDYSPLGMVNAINSGRNLKNSISNGQYNAKMQHQFVQNLGKATAGTMLYILGYALAKAGITSGESDDDKDTKDFMKNTLGISSYSIKIGGKTFTYDWAQPIAAPLSIMANIVNKQKEGATLTENIISSLDTAGNILLEQSFMESINTVLNNNDGIVTGIQEAILELPSRAIPTLMKQIVDLTDYTQRTTFEYDKPLQTAVNKVKAKIPGLSTTLSPVVDTMGREVQRYGGKNNIFNVFLNPANINTENISESAEEIYRVYKATGDKTVMPRVIPYYFNEDGVKKTLTSKERSEFQKISGKIIEDNVSNLLNNINYVNMSDTDKSTVLNNIVNYAYNKARYEMFGTEMSNVYNKVNEWTSQGGSVSDYYANKEENDYSLENPKKYNTMVSFDLSYADYNKFSQEINSLKNQYSDANSRKQAVWQYIQNQKLTKVQKILLYKLFGGYSISNYKDYMFNYINNQNITKAEKQEIWKYLYE